MWRIKIKIDMNKLYLEFCIKYKWNVRVNFK